MPEPVLSLGLMAAAGYTAVAALSRSGTAVSAEADAVREKASEVIRWGERSVALFGPKAGALTRLAELAVECSEADWDGYGAEPVDEQAVEMAGEIIRSLPDGLPLPELSIEPDGGVSLDWLPTPTRTFTLSTSRSNRLPYAWVDGTDRGTGVARYMGSELPDRVLAEIRRICSNEPSLRAA